MYEDLISKSIVLIGERYPSKIAWRQLHDAHKQPIDESKLRGLISKVGIQVLRRRPPPGSVRKISGNWRIIYYETTPVGSPRSSIYALLTKEERIKKDVKLAMRSVTQRGGLYSPKRFFNELLDLLKNKKLLMEDQKLTLSKALGILESINVSEMDVNQVGRLLSLIQRSGELSNDVLEQIHYLAYEMLTYLENLSEIDIDIDLGLDGAYTVAENYREREVFHLALELYKKIVPLAMHKNRVILWIASQVKIAQLYLKYFPMSDELIISTLNQIEKKNLDKANQSDREIYFTLLGIAYENKGDLDTARKYYLSAIDVAESDIAEPMWILKAYAFFGKYNADNYFPEEAVRNYLTASSLAFSAGDLTLADTYRTSASKEEMVLSYWEMVQSARKRAEGDMETAEYNAWNSLRLMLRAYDHIETRERYTLVSESKNILNMASKILAIEGKRRRNLSVVRKFIKLVENLQLQKSKKGQEEQQINYLHTKIDAFIPLPPPTFFLIALDGRMITSGKIIDSKWEESDIESVVFSGIITAIMALLSEVSDSSLRTIDAGNFKIIIERDDNAAAVLLVDREHMEFREKLKIILKKIDLNLRDRVRYWEGRDDIAPKIQSYVLDSLSELY